VTQPYVEPTFQEFLQALIDAATALNDTAVAATGAALSASAANRRVAHLAAARACIAAAASWRIACSFHRNALLVQSFQFAANATQNELQAAQHQVLAVAP
jgi:hypothetical protein